jgi:hypothetical protein
MTALEFWARPHTWPHDSHGYVFLARAIEEIGRAMFGQDWTGEEVTTEHVRRLPHQWQATPGDASYARAILMTVPEHAKQLPAPKPVLPPSLNNLSRQPPRPVIVQPDSFTKEQWLAAQAAVRRQQEERAPALQRLSQVQLNIVKRCESAELISATRPTVGGGMTLIPSEWWNTENWHNRFHMCQLNPSDRFGIGSTGQNHCWIFLTRESLEKFLLSQPFASVATNTDVHLSPYLKTMLAVAKKLNITPENQPKLEVVTTELRACWTGSEPLSDRLLRAAATLLREPESKLGRAKKRQNVS